MQLPNNAQIELVEGCNRMCEFCGIWGIWKNKNERKVKRMNTDLAFALAEEFGKWWKKGKRIEFAMHGEPTLHARIFDIIKKFRKYNPKAQLQLTTNGSRLTRYMINLLFEAGLNILMIDVYDDKSKDNAYEAIRNNKIKVQSYYSKDCINPYYYHNEKLKIIILIDDLGSNNKRKAQRVILNHAGNVDKKYWHKYGIQPVLQPLSKKCSRPFREIVVHWDGTIPLCCIDWKHEFIVGRFPTDGSLDELWNSNIMNTARHLLYNKQRWFRPCYKCDYNGGFRLGLLKDPNIDPDQNFEEILKTHYADMNDYAHDRSGSYFCGQTPIRKFLKRK